MASALSSPSDSASDVAYTHDETIDKKELESSHASVAGGSFVEGSEGVTHEELTALRHLPDSIPFAAFLVVIVEFAERWASYATGLVWGNYIRAGLPPGSTTGAVPVDHRADGVAGALRSGAQVSFAIRNFYTFWVYVTPFFGGFIADCYLGRYKTILYSSFVCLVGHTILVGTSVPSSLAHPNGALAGLIVSIIVMGIGAGSIKANVSPMIAEQYTGKLKKKTLPSGEVVIISPVLAYQRIYMYYYAAINVGACGAISSSFIARDYGFWATYLVPAGIFCPVPLVLLYGRKRYNITPPRGSIILECFRVLGVAGRERISWNPIKTITEFRKPGFWNLAKPSYYAAGKRPRSITWDDTFVEEVARTFKAVKVFLFLPLFWWSYMQVTNNMATVSASLVLGGTPNDLIAFIYLIPLGWVFPAPVTNPTSVILMVPVFDYVIYPALRSVGINHTPTKRTHTGFLVCGVALLYSAVLQKFVYKESPCHGNHPSECLDAAGFPNPAPINVWVASGPYILIGVAEIFTSITSFEYAFTKAPKQMKGFVTALSQFPIAIAAALGFTLAPVNTEDRFIWVYGALGITSWVAGTLFFIMFRKLDAQETELNVIGTGEREGFEDEHEEDEPA